MRRLNFLDGKKTYIGVIILFILGGLFQIGVIDQRTFEVLITLAGGFTAFGVRQAIK